MIYLTIGFSLLQGWLWSMFLNGPIVYKIFAERSVYAENAFILFILFNSIAYLFITLAAKQLATSNHKQLLQLIAAAFISISTMLFLFYDSSQWENLIFVVAVSGLSFPFLVVACGELFSRIEFNKAALSYGIAAMLGTAILFINASLDLEYALIIAGIIPLLAWFFIFKTQKALASNIYTKEPNASRSNSLFPFSLKFILLLFIFYGVGGQMHRICFILAEPPVQNLFLISNSLYCTVCLTAAWLLYRKPSFTPVFIFRMVVPLLGTGFILLPFLNNSWLLLSFVLLQMGFALFDLFIWLVIIKIASKSVLPLKVFSSGFFLVTSFILIGSLMDKAITPLLFSGIAHVDAIAITATLIMIISNAFFSDSHIEECENNEKPTILDNTMALPIDDTSQKLETLMELHKLTKREKEILGLIVKGYNNPYLCESLNISSNTLKTHLRNTYRKLDVKNRQEFLEKFH